LSIIQKQFFFQSSCLDQQPFPTFKFWQMIQVFTIFCIAVSKKLKLVS